MIRDDVNYAIKIAALRDPTWDNAVINDLVTALNEQLVNLDRTRSDNAFTADQATDRANFVSLLNSVLYNDWTTRLTTDATNTENVWLDNEAIYRGYYTN